MAAINRFGAALVGISIAFAYVLVGKPALASCGSWESLTSTTYGTTWAPTGDQCLTGNPNDPTTLSQVEWGITIETNGETSNAVWDSWSYDELSDTTGYWVELQVDCNGTEWTSPETHVPSTSQHVGPAPDGVAIVTSPSCAGAGGISSAVAWVWTD